MTVPTEPFLKLINEVFGLAAFEHEIREVIGNTNWNVLAERARDARAAYPALTAALAVEAAAHPDDVAVDRFATAMKAKLAKKRDEGRGGWENKEECSAEFLSHLLREHVEKGDPVDVGNLAMMLQQRGERISALTPASSAVEGEAVALDVDALAQEIRRVDGKHSLGAGALAEALMPFLRSRPAPTPAGEWLTVDSAPKDGTTIIYRNRFGDIGYAEWYDGQGDFEQAGWWDTQADDEVVPVRWLPASALPDFPAPQTEDRADA